MINYIGLNIHESQHVQASGHTLYFLRIIDEMYSAH